MMKFIIEIELPDFSNDDEHTIREYLVYVLNQHAIGPHVKQVLIDDSPEPSDTSLRCGHMGPREATSTCVLNQGHSGEHTDEANGTWPQY